MHDKSNYISWFINGKSKNIQTFLKYLSGIVTSRFKVGTAGCGGQFASPGFPGCGGLSSVFSTGFVLYLHDFQSEVLSSTSLISSL